MELFSETALGAPLHTFSKLYEVLVGFITPPPPPFEAVYCFICGRRRVAVARYRMICLILVKSYDGLGMIYVEKKHTILKGKDGHFVSQKCPYLVCNSL